MHGDVTGVNLVLLRHFRKLMNPQTNILIDKRGHARLINFGLSTVVRSLLDQSHLAVSSIRYAAPEVILSNDSRDFPLEKADIYSFGCVMLQVSCCFHPQDGRLRDDVRNGFFRVGCLGLRSGRNSASSL